jgi:hypothetical protein
MLTNFTTIYRRLQRLKELEAMEATGATDVLPKKEVLRLQHEREKLERNLGGIRDMTRLPAAVWVVDTRKEHIAVTEARKLGIPVVAILDTNCDPDEVDYPIPGNDDAIRAGSLLTRIVADAVAEGLRLRSVYASEGAGDGEATISASPADEEPLAEWERELLESDSGDQADTSRIGRTDDTAAAATASAGQPAASGRSGSQGASASRAATPSRSGARSATQAEAGTRSETQAGRADGAGTEGTAPTAEGRGAPPSRDEGATSAASEDATTAASEATSNAEGEGAASGASDDAAAAGPEDTTAASDDAADAGSDDATDADSEDATADATDTAAATDPASDDAAATTPREAAEVAADPTNDVREPRV